MLLYVQYANAGAMDIECISSALTGSVTSGFQPLYMHAHRYYRSVNASLGPFLQNDKISKFK